MRRLLFGTVACAAFTLTSAANAAITIGSNMPGVNPYAGPAPTYSFDPGSRPTVSGGSFVTGTLGVQHAQPFGTAAGTGAYGGAGYYYAVGPSDGTPGTIDLSSLGAINSISLIWGSVDSYNTLDFCADSACSTILQSFVGNDIFDPANGNRTDPNTNPLVTFLLNNGDENNFAFLRLRSGDNAFEIDNLTINPVPEPATWALMLVGFVGIGMTLRSRRRPVLAQLA